VLDLGNIYPCYELHSQEGNCIPLRNNDLLGESFHDNLNYSHGTAYSQFHPRWKGEYEIVDDDDQGDLLELSFGHCVLYGGGLWRGCRVPDSMPRRPASIGDVLLPNCYFNSPIL